ncbi:rCG39063 [Rattus norvegicus]|uniref:RCG39063 n=1 Tax=Rattus norvegicus TaxID=10116 RepID=A6JY73_RAT|nr:rCG39063 [Rattus norvegicus]
MDPAPALAPANANNANAPPARKAAVPAAPWAVRSAPRAASAKRLRTSAAAAPEVGASSQWCK